MGRFPLDGPWRSWEPERIAAFAVWSPKMVRVPPADPTTVMDPLSELRGVAVLGGVRVHLDQSTLKVWVVQRLAATAGTVADATTTGTAQAAPRATDRRVSSVFC
ncbi:hypothetical protein TPCV2_12630 [Cutibacterium avidum]|nr:hypothetical protein TPCV4_21670 [Cutibacterium avidum]